MHRFRFYLLIIFASAWGMAPSMSGGLLAHAQQRTAGLVHASPWSGAGEMARTVPLEATSTGYTGASSDMLRTPGVAVSQPVAFQSDRIASLVHQRTEAERAHLWRIAAWGTLNAAGGLALVLGTGRQQNPAFWGFGAQSGLWGVVNVGIATAGLLSGGDPASGFEAAVAAERTYHDILLFNLGLNVAYSAVGTTLLAVSYRGVDAARSLRGHGTSLIMQGAGLLLLDAIAFFGSRARLAGLLDVAGSVSARALPSGAALSISF